MIREREPHLLSFNVDTTHISNSSHTALLWVVDGETERAVWCHTFQVALIEYISDTLIMSYEQQGLGG